MNSELLDVSAVARKLSVSKKRVYQLIQEGKLDSLRMSPRSIRVTRESLDGFIADGIKKEKADLGLDFVPFTPPPAKILKTNLIPQPPTVQSRFRRIMK